MFTINIYLKWALTALFLLGGVILAVTISFWYAFPLLIIGLILLASYLFLGTVQSAAQLMQDGDFEACERRLDLTFKPSWLYVTNKAFYFLIKGSIAMNAKDSDEAEAWFNRAKDIKLPSDNERAMVLLQLANINAMKGKWNAAKHTFREIKKLKISEGQLKEQISQFEQALKQRGQIKQAGRRGQRMQAPGGKRRRPKMR
ncbi:MAG: hypothetical protein R3275_06285 [Saprospiraceae bacterium]|nr:hypothetical protein [Saprospiraceae bacterium]